MMELRVKRLRDTSKLPTRANRDDAGLDLYADIPASIEIQVGQKVNIRTGISMEIPDGHYGRIASRSGMGNKGTDVFGGVIDRTYRGELAVMLANLTGNGPITINPGDRVAQLVIEKYGYVDVVEVEELSDTDRGAAGFGSTGQ